ncbi:MAG: hypothetical protein AB1753_09305 [Thermoproteota archaeon]
MIPSIPFLDLATGMLSAVIEGTAAYDYAEKPGPGLAMPPAVFVVPQVDIRLPCFIKSDGKLQSSPALIEVIPSNAVSSNYYGIAGGNNKYESIISIQLKRIPGAAQRVR